MAIMGRYKEEHDVDEFFIGQTVRVDTIDRPGVIVGYSLLNHVHYLAIELPRDSEHPGMWGGWRGMKDTDTGFIVIRPVADVWAEEEDE